MFMPKKICREVLKVRGTLRFFVLNNHTYSFKNTGKQGIFYNYGLLFQRKSSFCIMFLIRSLLVKNYRTNWITLIFETQKSPLKKKILNPAW